MNTEKIAQSVKKSIRLYLEEDLSYTAKWIHSTGKVPEGLESFQDLYRFMTENSLFARNMTEEEKKISIEWQQKIIQYLEYKMVELYKD